MVSSSQRELEIMYRRILVPVDGSATSKLGLRHALGLAKDQQARVRILNVVDEMALVPMMDGYPADMTAILESMREAGNKAVEEAGMLAQRAHVKADTTTVDSRGRVVSDVILAEAKKFHADLIVMGTHGRRGLNRLILGSDAERVLREAPVPVLLVRGDRSTGRAVKKRRRA
jgi:nucleotide-binding universal stress UspA family protein